MIIFQFDAKISDRMTRLLTPATKINRGGVASPSQKRGGKDGFSASALALVVISVSGVSFMAGVMFAVGFNQCRATLSLQQQNAPIKGSFT
jgi:hypothetical protein